MEEEANWVERKAEEWFGTPERKMRLLQWLVYISNLYVFFGILVLIWIFHKEHIIELWNYLIK